MTSPWRKLDVPYGLKMILEKEWPRVINRANERLGDSWPVPRNPWLGYLGRGYFGSVVNIGYPYVVKFSLDPNEARIVRQVIRHDALRYHPGVAYYVDQWHTRSMARGGSRRVDVFIRENIHPVGGLKNAEMYDRSLDIIGDIFGAARNGNVEPWLAALDRAIDDDFAFLVADFQLRFFEITGFMLTDIHDGNVGVRRHQILHDETPDDYSPSSGDALVIFDIGHWAYAEEAPFEDYVAPVLNPVLF